MGGAIDRRDHARWGVDLAVTVTGPDGRRVTGVSRDVSLGGVFLPNRLDLPAGTDCRVEMTFGAGRERVRVALQGRVARITDDGTAIEYTYIDADNHARLHELFASDAAHLTDE